MVASAYLRSIVNDTLQQTAEVVKWSSTNNAAQLYDWQWRDWDGFVKKLFRKVPLITK